MKTSEKVSIYCNPSVFLFILCYALVSCTSPKNAKKAVYFGNVGDTILQNPAISLEPIIHKSDLLSISVSSLNPQASMIFNAPNTPTMGAGTTSISEASFQSFAGYLVNQDGQIQFPILGSIKADGLTKKQLSEEITKKLIDNKLLVDPIVTIRFLNFRVTVLGEVGRPNTINVPNEKITILEAIGLAGDLTVYAKRDNVLLIREEEGKKIIKRINLNSGKILESPYYYLKSNDIVYAEPSKSKVSSASNTQVWLPSILSALGFIAIIMSVIFD
jgi:polysaccharide biosynthesis/export protein